MTAISSSPFARQRRLAMSAVALVGALALASCAGRVNPYEKTGAVPEDYRTNHPITLEEQISTLDVPVSIDTAALTKPMRSNVAFFAQSFLASGSAVVAVVAPSGSPNQLAAAGIAVEVEQVLRETGVDPRVISYRVYRADRSEKIAPVRIAFSRVAATTAPCGPWSDQMTVNATNEHYDSYGCATQQNLAAMVENPLDLLYPRGLTPADATRRATVLERYRLGSLTGASRPLGEGGTISGVGN